MREYGELDIAIDNAGYSLRGCVGDIAFSSPFPWRLRLVPRKWVKGRNKLCTYKYSETEHSTIRVIKAVLPPMRADESETIVNIGSIAGLDGCPMRSLFSKQAFSRR